MGDDAANRLHSEFGVWVDDTEAVADAEFGINYIRISGDRQTRWTHEIDDYLQVYLPAKVDDEL